MWAGDGGWSPGPPSGAKSKLPFFESISLYSNLGTAPVRNRVSVFKNARLYLCVFMYVCMCDFFKLKSTPLEETIDKNLICN